MWIFKACAQRSLHESNPDVKAMAHQSDGLMMVALVVGLWPELAGIGLGQVS